ncbi:hypothetical protein ABCR94_24965 [Streptomyces sp. 21So2-11]|uniref:DUF7848 domain-containing protein n=1 Tax=Streptomyces sp. 21So2-11 TaxID=3144408 RepID=UPI0032199C19
MTRSVMRFVPYTIAQDQTAWPEYVARCVSGDEKECGAESGSKSDPADVEKWMTNHTRGTGHLRYRRTFADYAVFEPPEGAEGGRVIPGEVVEHARAIEVSHPLAIEPRKATA